MKKSLKILLGVMLVLASMAILFTRVNAEESKPTIEMTVDGSFYVGISKEFTISTTRPENYNGGKVYGTGGVEDESVLDKFEVLDYTGWKNLKGETLGNSDEGFDLTTGSLKFRATFNKAGEYNVKYVLKEVGTDNVVAENSIVLKVEEPSINMTVDGNFYVGK